MHLSKRYRIASAALVLMLGAAACSSGDEGGSSGDGPVTISLAAIVFSEPGRGEAAQQIVDDFNASQSEVVVETSTVPYPEFHRTMMTQMAAGSGPDLFTFDIDQIYPAIEAGFMEPLDDLPMPDNVSVADQFTAYDGHRYGIIWEAVNFALLINRELFDQAQVEVPTSTEELLSAAAMLTDGDQFGLAFRHTMDQEVGWWMDLSNWVYGHGGAWTTPDGTPVVNSPENVAAVTAFQAAYQAESIPRGVGSADYRRMFAEGKVAMMIENTTVPTQVTGINPAAAEFMEAYPIPFGDPTNVQIAIVLGLNAQSPDERKDAAKDFMEYLLTDEVQAQHLLGTGGSGVAVQTELPEDLVSERPWLPAFHELGADTQTVVTPGAETRTAEIRTAVLQEIETMLVNSGDPQEALDRAQEGVESLLAD